MNQAYITTVAAIVAPFMPSMLAAHPNQIVDVRTEAAAPFVSRPSVKLTADELEAMSRRQNYLTASTATPEAVVIKVVPSDSGAQAVHEIRRLSGLTWVQVSKVFGVSRRAAHDWGAGKRIAPINRYRVGKVLSVLQYTDRGSVEANQALLHSGAGDGRTVFELLCAGEFEEMKQLCGEGNGRSANRNIMARSYAFNAPSHFGNDLMAMSSASFDEIRLDPPKLRRAKPRRRAK